MYKLTDKVEVQLNKVTPKTLKALKECGVWDYDKPLNEVFIELQKIYVEDDARFRLLLKALFQNVPDELELEEVNLDEVSNAIFDFFGKLAGHLGKLSFLSVISQNSDLTTN